MKMLALLWYVFNFFNNFFSNFNKCLKIGKTSVWFGKGMFVTLQVHIIRVQIIKMVKTFYRRMKL
jgi:hypothetical protein